MVVNNSSWREASKGDGIEEYMLLCYDRGNRIKINSICFCYKAQYKPKRKPQRDETNFSKWNDLQCGSGRLECGAVDCFPYGVITDSIKFSIVSTYERKNGDDMCITWITAYISSSDLCCLFETDMI